jgi:hypothetical protein
MKRTEDNMVCEPGNQKPARTIEAAEHKHSTKNGEQPNKADPDQALFKRIPFLELGKVVQESNATNSYEYPTDNGDRSWTLDHVWW